MGKATSIVVAIALAATGCIHAPANKPRAYVTGGAAVVVGGGTAYLMSQRSCSGGSVGDDIGCSIGSNLVGLMGLTLAVAGLATIGVTAFAPDAESK